MFRHAGNPAPNRDCARKDPALWLMRYKWPFFVFVGKINKIEFSKIELYKLSPRGRRDDMLPADGSSTRGGSTFVSGRVRGPHIFGGRPAAGSRRADSLGSYATQPACYSLGWDRRTDRRTDRGIA